MTSILTLTSCRRPTGHLILTNLLQYDFLSSEIHRHDLLIASHKRIPDLALGQPAGLDIGIKVSGEVEDGENPKKNLNTTASGV
jgi:hypothetical protein